MLRRFTREKEEMRKKTLVPAGLPRPNAKVPNANSALLNTPHKVSGSNDCSITDLSTDPAVLSLLGSANNDMLQDMMGDLDFGMLDSPQPSSPAQGENGSFGMGLKAGVSRVAQGSVIAPPPLPSGLPGPLAKRIEDLRSVRTGSRVVGYVLKAAFVCVTNNASSREALLTRPQRRQRRREQ